MGKTLLIDTAPIPNNPTTSHCRSIQVIAKELNLQLVSKIEDFKQLNPEDYSKYAVFGSAFYQKTAEIESFIRKSKSPVIVWMNNEHTCSPNSEYARLIKDYDSVVISNLVEKANKVKGYDSFHLINLNCLLAKPVTERIYKKYDFLYYGTYRPGRRVYFQKYFSENDCFILASKTKNLRKFHQLAGCNCRFADSPDWTIGKESFNLVKYTIYLEDEQMHKNFNHLSNRFYEALFCNVVQFFESSCINTIQTHGMYHIPDKYIVSSKSELIDKIKSFDFPECLHEQLLWNEIALKEKVSVLSQLRKLLL